MSHSHEVPPRQGYRLFNTKIHLENKFDKIADPKVALFSHVMELSCPTSGKFYKRPTYDSLYLDESIVNSTGKD